MIDELTRPIVGIENRTAQEVFDIMVARIRRSALSPGSTGEAEGWVLVPKEPNSAQLDRAAAFALNVSLGGDYRWTDYMRDLYGRFLSAAGER